MQALELASKAPGRMFCPKHGFGEMSGNITAMFLNVVKFFVRNSDSEDKTHILS